VVAVDVIIVAQSALVELEAVGMEQIVRHQQEQTELQTLVVAAAEEAAILLILGRFPLAATAVLAS
jgi:hypothetical protein